MKPLPQELKRLRQLALVQKRISPDTKIEVTKKDLADFIKEVQSTVQNKKKHLFIVCVETDKGEE